MARLNRGVLRPVALLMAAVLVDGGCIRSLRCPEPPPPAAAAPRLVPHPKPEPPPRLVRKSGAGPQPQPLPSPMVIPLPERTLEASPTSEIDLFADHYEQQQADARETLAIMSGVTIVSGVGIMILMTLLPASATHWDKGADLWDNFSSTWTSPPVWDSDSWPVNYLVHPWMGSIFYLLARDLDAKPLGSWAYSTGMSVSWEYLIEGWSEQPSIQDLITTSNIGSVLGEGIHWLRTTVLHDDTEGLTWKKTVGWILDPVDLTYTLLDFKPKPYNPAPAAESIPDR